MKRLGLVLAGLALAGAVNTADAQLTMQMGNGWSATFAGNINAFWIYTDVNSKDCAAGDCTTVDGAGTKVNGIGTGLLPAFFTFDAKGTEGPVTLGAHVGFAPQVTWGATSPAASVWTPPAPRSTCVRYTARWVASGARSFSVRSWACSFARTS